MSEILSVKEMRAILLRIDNCEKTKTVQYTDDTTEQEPCTIESMCDDCIADFAGLLEWAEDMEDEQPSIQN